MRQLDGPRAPAASWQPSTGCSSTRPRVSELHVSRSSSRPFATRTPTATRGSCCSPGRRSARGWRALHYQRLWGDGERFRLHRPASGGVLRFAHPGSSALARAVLAELAFLETLLAARTLVDSAVRPSAVRFVHAPLGPTGKLAEVLGVEPVFGARANELALPSAVLDAPVRLPEGMLSAVLERKALDSLRSLHSAPSTAARVRAICGDAPHGLSLGVEAVARRLRMSPRTLQRKLHDEGTTFAEVIDLLRRERVAELSARGLPTKEIAFLVGYADPSALARARARWQRA